MKRNIFIYMLLALLLGFPFNGIAQENNMASHIKAGEYDPNGELIVVTARGLVCDFCAKALEKVFLKREEISGIGTNLTTKEIHISLKQGEVMDDDVLKELIKDSGYNAENIERIK